MAIPSKPEIRWSSSLTQQWIVQIVSYLKDSFYRCVAVLSEKRTFFSKKWVYFPLLKSGFLKLLDRTSL